jgi:hypothetical protein
MLQQKERERSWARPEFPPRPPSGRARTGGSVRILLVKSSDFIQQAPPNCICFTARRFAPRRCWDLGQEIPGFSESDRQLPSRQAAVSKVTS